MPPYHGINVTELPISFFLLNPNVTSRFPVNASVIEIVKQLGIEDWNDYLDYESYYNNCNPEKCFYVITKKLYFSTFITTVLGLIGGLSTILKISIPPIIRLTRWLQRIRVDYTTTFASQS